MLTRFLLAFAPLSLLGLALFCILALLSLQPSYRAVDRALESELHEAGANAAAGFMANLEGTFDLVASMASFAGVEISNFQQTETQGQKLVPNNVRQILSAALGINKSLISLTVFDPDGNPVYLIGNGGKRQGAPLAPPMPWAPTAVEANKSIANILANGNRLHIAHVLPSFSPRRPVGFLYAEIDFTEWLATEMKALSWGGLTQLKNRRVDIKLQSGKSDIDQQIKQSFGYLPKDSHKVQLRRSLPSPLAGNELLIEVSADASTARATARHSVYLVLGMTVFAWAIIVWLIHYFRKRFVLPLRRMSFELHRTLAAEESDRGGQYHDSVKRLAQLLGRLTEELDQAKQGKTKRLEDTYSELFRTRARLEQIASSSGVVAMSFCRLTGKFLYRTSSLSEFMKFSGAFNKLKREITWRDLYREVSRQQGGALRDCMRILRRQGVSRMQLALSGVNGKRIYELRFRLQRADQTRVASVDLIALDNTERAIAELGRIASEERKSAIINVAPDAYLSMASDGLILEANPALEKLTGWRNIEMVGLNARGLIFNAADFSRIENLFAEESRSAGEITLVVGCLLKSGLCVPVEVRGAIVASAGEQAYVCVYIQDLRQRLNRDVALFRKGREIEEVFDLSPDGIAIFNEKNRLLRINKRLVLFLLDAGVKIELGCALDEFWNLLRGKSELRAHQTLCFCRHQSEGAAGLKDSVFLTLKYIERILSDEFVEGFSKVIYFTDITQEFQLDELKSGFLATAAHELRTPLAIILGFSELLGDEEYSADERKALSRSIYMNSLRLSALLNDLLDLSRIEAGGSEGFKFEIVDMTRLLQGFLLNSTVLKSDVLTYSGHRLKVEITRLEGVKVRVDVHKIERVLHNLLSNAVKYGCADADIEIHAHVDRRDSEDWVILEIIDHGVGMTSTEIEHAFDRFWRSDSKTGTVPGTGLGLPIARVIMTHHGGEINLRSQFGRGTVVVLAIPVFAPDSVGLNQDAAVLELDQK